MKASRNDPCPCGSGKKYKACCMGRDQVREQVERTFGPRAVAQTQARVTDAARRAPFWEADVVPLTGGTIRETGSPGALAIVGADGFVLTGEVLGRRPAGVDDRAQAVLSVVMAAARDAGELPERLRVRDAALADALRPELERRGIVPEAAPLPELDQAVNAALERLTDSAAGGRAFTLWTWSETEASAKELAELHDAAAAYYQAEPWRVLVDGEPLLLSFPGEDRPWAASVMGGAGFHYGLALYSDPADVEALYASGGDTDEHVAGMRGYSLSLSYDAAGDLPRPLRREVVSAGWTVASQDAYPALISVNLPGRRVTADQVRRTALACRAVTAFVKARPRQLPWTAPVGVQVAFMEVSAAGDEIAFPWPVLGPAHPVGPAGPNADPGATLRAWAGSWQEYHQAEVDRLTRFVTWLDRQKPSRAARDRETRTATEWSRMLISAGVPAQSVTEYDLRVFLYDFLPLAGCTKPMGAYLTRSLRRLFRYYAEHEGIEYPWAEGVLNELDMLAADTDDVRDVLEGLQDALPMYAVLRALRPAAEVPDTATGWAIVVDERVGDLRHELHRSWLGWYDEVVRGGITEVDDVRDILLGRQRQWENTPHPGLDGMTPRQVLKTRLERMEAALPKFGAT